MKFTEVQDLAKKVNQRKLAHSLVYPITIRTEYLKSNPDLFPESVLNLSRTCTLAEIALKDAVDEPVFTTLGYLYKEACGLLGSIEVPGFGDPYASAQCMTCIGSSNCTECLGGMTQDIETCSFCSGTGACSSCNA